MFKALKKNWPIIVVVVLIVAVIYIFITKDSTTKTAGTDDIPSNTDNLNNNSDAYLAWGCTIDMNTSRNSFTVKGQGAGNAFQHTWTLQELRDIWVNQHLASFLAQASASGLNYGNGFGVQSTGPYAETILVSEYSTDGDFFMAVYLAGELGTNILYIYAGVYDPLSNIPNPPVSTNAKAALRLDGLASDNPVSRQITVLKTPEGKFNLS